MGFYGIRRRKPQIERTAAGGFVAAQAGDPRSEALPRADGKHRKHEEQNRWMKTTVVIPNYNGKHFLQDCLDSLLQSTVEIAVIVVDNGSTDGSVSWIQEHFPQVKLICFSENKGFCTAVNTGIEAAATPYVFLLNNDTKTDRFCLERLERAMEADEKIFSVGAKMLSMKEPELVDTAGICTRHLAGRMRLAKEGLLPITQRQSAFFPIVQGRHSTARHTWSRSEGLTSFILHTWKMWISDTGRRFSG